MPWACFAAGGTVRTVSTNDVTNELYTAKHCAHIQPNAVKLIIVLGEQPEIFLRGRNKLFDSRPG